MPALFRFRSTTSVSHNPGVGDDWSMMNTSLDAEQEPPEAPETVEEEPEGTEPRSYAPGTQEGSERPWWRRFFGVE